MMIQAEQIKTKVELDEERTHHAAIVIPAGCKSMKGIRKVVVKPRFDPLASIVRGEKKIQKEWVSTVADATVFTGAVVNTLVIALRSASGVGVAMLVVFAIIAVIRVAR